MDFVRHIVYPTFPTTWIIWYCFHCTPYTNDDVGFLSQGCNFYQALQ